MSKKLTHANMNAIAGTPLSPVDFTYKAKDGEEIAITINPNIGLEGTYSLANAIVGGVFAADGTYVPEYRETATFIAVIRELSNIPLPKASGATDVDTCYKWMLATDLLNSIRHSELGEWFSGIEKAASEKIEFQKQEILAKHQSNFNYVEGKLEELINAYSALGEKFASLDPNETMDIAKKLVSTDTEKIASKIVDIRDAQAKKPVKKTTTKKKEI